MLPMYARAAVSALPGASLIPFLGATSTLEEETLRLPDIRADPVRLAAYREICGFKPGKHLPITYLHILAFPLHMKLLTSPGQPFSAVGLVHIENRILTDRPIDQREPLTLQVRLAAPEPHPRGEVFRLLTEASVAGERVWRSASTMLHRHASTKEPGRDSSSGRARPRVVQRERSLAAPWQLPRTLGRRYAAISGDRNPIHTHPLAARALGFSGVIAHGMWSKARVLAALEAELPAACAVHVRFRKPIVLPATIQLARPNPQNGGRFTVRDAARHTLHLEGRILQIGHPSAELTEEET